MINLISFLLFFSAGTVEKHTLTTNEHITLEISAPLTLGISAKGSLSFTFTPIEGVHINTAPNIDFRLDKDSHFEIIGSAQIQKNEKEYLDITKPVMVTVKVKKGTAAGKTVIKGKLNYFYCSDKEGWCNRLSQPVELNVKITR